MRATNRDTYADEADQPYDEAIGTYDVREELDDYDRADLEGGRALWYFATRREARRCRALLLKGGH